MGSPLLHRHQDELFFVSERDGNMELYSRHVKNEMTFKHSYQRMTSDPSLQVSIILSLGTCTVFHICSVISPSHSCYRYNGWHARISLPTGGAAC